MRTLHILGKYLDQPKLVKTIKKAVPTVLIASGVAYSFNHIRKTPEKQRHNELVKDACILSATIGSALLAPRIASRFVKGHTHEKSVDVRKLVDDFLKGNQVSDDVRDILTTAKEKFLKFGNIKKLFEELQPFKKGNEKTREFLIGEHGLIPDPENIDSKHIFDEIKRLSVLGAVPVLGGITGGIVGDRLTEKDWKERIPNKIKEGAYQYLANIFLCNVGAGGALYAMEKSAEFVSKNKEKSIELTGYKKHLFNVLEKMNVQSKATRALSMMSGIVVLGVIGGSAIANAIGKTCIDPFLERKHRNQRTDGKGHMNNHKKCLNNENCKRSKGLYAERKPEALDIGLHVDDIATVAVLSGLKWIEPALPILYSISGYRAGIGYRNN